MSKEGFMNVMSRPTMWGRRLCSDLCFGHTRQCYTCGWMVADVGIKSSCHKTFSKKQRKVSSLRDWWSMVTSCLMGKRYAGCNTCSCRGAAGLEGLDYWIL